MLLNIPQCTGLAPRTKHYPAKEPIVQRRNPITEAQAKCTSAGDRAGRAETPWD